MKIHQYIPNSLTDGLDKRKSQIEISLEKQRAINQKNGTKEIDQDSKNLAIEAKKKMLILDYLKLATSKFKENDVLKIEMEDIYSVTKKYVSTTANTEQVNQIDLINNLISSIEGMRSNFIMSLEDIKYKLLNNLEFKDQYLANKTGEYKYRCSDITKIMKDYSEQALTRASIDSHTKPDKIGYIKLPSTTLEGEAKSILESDMIDYVNEKGIKKGFGTDNLKDLIDADFRKEYAYKAPISSK